MVFSADRNKIIYHWHFLFRIPIRKLSGIIMEKKNDNNPNYFQSVFMQIKRTVRNKITGSIQFTVGRVKIR